MFADKDHFIVSNWSWVTLTAHGTDDVRILPADLFEAR